MTFLEQLSGIEPRLGDVHLIGRVLDLLARGVDDEFVIPLLLSRWYESARREAEMDWSPRTGEVEAEIGPALVRAFDWFWRPWYAKAWWIAAAIFWPCGFLLTEFWHPGPADETGWGFLLMMAFHPFVIVPVLGLGYLRAFFNRAWAEAEDGDEAEPGMNDGDPVSGFRRQSYSPYFERKSIMDPTNLTAIWNPANPISPEWRDRHVRGKD